VSRLKEMGWQAQIGLEDGIKQTYQEFAAGYGAQAVRLPAHA